MSSFKRKTQNGSASIPGTRVSPFNSALLLSTGIASLDDILGGGVQVGSSIAIGEDTEKAYAALLLKFWIAQGLVSSTGHHVAIIGESPESITDRLMAVEGGASSTMNAAATSSQSMASNEDNNSTTSNVDIVDDDDDVADEETSGMDKQTRMTIAFRYESLKSFQTAVDSSSSPSYCSIFDLTKTQTLSDEQRSRLHTFDINATSASSTTTLFRQIYSWLENLVEKLNFDPKSPPLRVAIHSLGNPAYGSWDNSTLSRFLLSLRYLIRKKSLSPCKVSVMLTFPSAQNFTCTTIPTYQLTHLVDYHIHLQSFASSPTQSQTFSSHSGLLHVITLPTQLNSLIPAATKLSVLRGLAPGANSATSGAGGMDNNLAFRVKRRRFILETLHLDVEGETHGERKIPSSSSQPDTSSSSHIPPPRHLPPISSSNRVDESSPKVTIQSSESSATGLTKAKRGVRFEDSSSGSDTIQLGKIRHDKPELYEF